MQRARPITTLPDDVTDVQAGRYHSLAVTAGGHMYSWGHGQGGRLGHGNEHTQPIPLLIATLAGASSGPSGTPSIRWRVTAIAAGDAHSLAATSDGILFSWGNDRAGQLGHGGSSGGGRDRDNRDSNKDMCLYPRRVDALKRYHAVAVAAGALHSLVVTRENQSTTTLWAFGSNKQGQLGVPS